MLTILTVVGTIASVIAAFASVLSLLHSRSGGPFLVEAVGPDALRLTRRRWPPVLLDSAKQSLNDIELIPIARTNIGRGVYLGNRDAADRSVIFDVREVPLGDLLNVEYRRVFTLKRVPSTEHIEKRAQGSLHSRTWFFARP